MNLDSLRKFLIEANKAGYTSGKEQKSEKDLSHTFIYESGDWKYHDNYFGGEPYGGRTIIFYKEKPVWIMVYYGKVNNNIYDINGIYGFLKKALSLVPQDYPFRGPAIYNETNLKYRNKWDGNIKSFYGNEYISYKGKRIYKAHYMGGLVDLRKD